MDKLISVNGSSRFYYCFIALDIASHAKDGPLITWGISKAREQSRTLCSAVDPDEEIVWIKFLFSHLDKEPVLMELGELLAYNPGCYYSYRINMLNSLAKDTYWQKTQVNNHEVRRIVTRFVENERALLLKAESIEMEYSDSLAQRSKP